MTTQPVRCAIWARVSTEDQHNENQLPMLRAWAADLGMEIAAEFVTEDSAWADGASGAKGTEFEAQRSAMLAGVRRGAYTVILVRAIDRLSRRGTEDMMRYLRLLADNGADVRSDQESWLNTADPFAREILIGVFATLAKYQSEQRSPARRQQVKRSAGASPGPRTSAPASAVAHPLAGSANPQVSPVHAAQRPLRALSWNTASAGRHKWVCTAPGATLSALAQRSGESPSPGHSRAPTGAYRAVKQQLIALIRQRVRTLRHVTLRDQTLV